MNTWRKSERQQVRMNVSGKHHCCQDTLGSPAATQNIDGLSTGVKLVQDAASREGDHHLSLEWLAFM